MKFDKKLGRKMRTGVLLLSPGGYPAPVYDLRNFPPPHLLRGILKRGMRNAVRGYTE